MICKILEKWNFRNNPEIFPFFHICFSHLKSFTAQYRIYVMHERGKPKTYHEQLSSVFIATAILVAAIAIIAGLLAERNIMTSTMHANESLEDVSSYMLSSRVNEISNTIDYLSTCECVLDWLYADIGSADYYYQGLLSYQELVRRSPVFNSGTFNIAITSDDASSFVITSGGTYSKREFLSYVTPGLVSLPAGDASISLTPDYSTLLMSVKRYLGEKTLIFYCTISLSYLSFPLESNIQYAFIDTSNGIIYTPFEEIGNKLEGLNLHVMQDGRLTMDNMSLRKESYSQFDFCAVYAHSTTMISPFIFMLIFIPCIILMCLYVSFKISGRLYRPVKEAYETLMSPEEEETRGNEFDTIIAKCQEADQISKKLITMSAELQNATDIQKYRSYLRGQDSLYRAEDDIAAFFCLSILSSGSLPDGRQATVNLTFNSMARKVKHLHFIITDSGFSVLIYKSNNSEECYSTLYRTLKEFTAIDAEAGLQAAITRPCEGWSGIKGLYQNALNIMDCRYILQDKIIMTEDDMIDNTGLMHYPISEERKLINAALSASVNTLDIFDAIVKDNTAPERMLTEKEFERFSSALISTVMRIFQEMKEDIDGDVNWKDLMDNQKPAAAISELRNLLAGYVERKNRENSERYDYLVDEMKKYIQAHYSENIQLIDLSEEFNLSPKYCSEVFNRLSGENFKNYLNRFRINEAQRILDENPEIRITQLASEVGFSSSNSFIRVFDKYMGITPKQYAESRKKEI